MISIQSWCFSVSFVVATVACTDNVLCLPFPWCRPPVLDIAIIGAGASGLAAAKNAIKEGHNVVLYEQTGFIGGVWYYTNQTDKDEFGVEIYTPMYKTMRFVLMLKMLKEND